MLYLKCLCTKYDEFLLSLLRSPVRCKRLINQEKTTKHILVFHVFRNSPCETKLKIVVLYETWEEMVLWTLSLGRKWCSVQHLVFMKAEKCLSFLVFSKENGLNEGWLGSISKIILLIDKEKCLEGKVCKNFLNPKVLGHL